MTKNRDFFNEGRNHLGLEGKSVSEIVTIVKN